MQKAKNALGSPVVGKDFIGRKLELSQAFHLLQLGTHLRLPAPRRVGKTSFTHALIQMAKSHGWKTIFVNVEHQKSELGFIKVFLEALEDDKSWIEKKTGSIWAATKTLLAGLELKFPLGDDLPEMTFRWNSPQTADLRANLEKILKNLGDCLIVVDELPWLLARIEKMPDGKERNEDLLHWLRPFRQKKERDDDPVTRWVFCGSISFEAVTERLNLSDSINDTYVFELGAFSLSEADECLRALSENPENRFDMSADLRQAVIDYLQWPLPYYLQVLFAKLRAIEQERNRPATPEDLPEAVEKASEYSNLSTWFERLNEQYLPADERLTKIILDQLCQTENRTRSQLERLLIKNKVAVEDSKERTAFLIRALKRDGYLLETNGLYTFRSPLLKKYWYNNRIK